MHKVTTKLAQTYRQIYAGDVSSCQLAKTKMAKSVLDAGWSAFERPPLQSQQARRDVPIGG